MSKYNYLHIGSLAKKFCHNQFCHMTRIPKT